MIKTLNIKNFKSLTDLTIEELGPLNLIVGKNNSGKSTVLEAIRILASNGSQSIINEIVESHDDNILSQYSSNDEDVSIYEGLFPERKFPSDDSSIYIGSINKKRFVEIQRVFYKDSEEEIQDDKGNRILSRKRSIFGLEDIDHDNPEELDQSLQITTNRNPERPSFIS
jgi:AAA15 family ATPase/GTPase